MPNRPFYPPPWQIPALLDGRATWVVMPFRVQPPPECSINYDIGNESWLEPDKRTPYRRVFEAWGGDLYARRPEGHLCGLFYLTPPFAPGDALVCKEAFYLTDDGHQERVVYAADQTDVADHIATCKRTAAQLNLSNTWLRPHLLKRSPVTMPAWAVRLRLHVANVTVRRIDALDEIEAMQCGLGVINTRPDRVYSAWDSNPCDELQEHWDQQHARKPGLAFGDGPWCAVGRVERVEE